MTYQEIAGLITVAISSGETVDGHFWDAHQPDHPFDNRRWWDFVNRDGVAERFGLCVVDTHTGGPNFFIERLAE